MVESFGISPRAWSSGNIKKIWDFWGEVVCLDKNTKTKLSFIFGKVLLDTLYLPYILKGGFIFLLEVKGLMYMLKRKI